MIVVVVVVPPHPAVRSVPASAASVRLHPVRGQSTAAERYCRKAWLTRSTGRGRIDAICEHGRPQERGCEMRSSGPQPPARRARNARECTPGEQLHTCTWAIPKALMSARAARSGRVECRRHRTRALRRGLENECDRPRRGRRRALLAKTQARHQPGGRSLAVGNRRADRPRKRSLAQDHRGYHLPLEDACCQARRQASARCSF